MPELPDEGGHIWDWFVQLHNARQSGFSANPISFGDIDCFCRLTGAVITPWELSVIRRIDQVVLAVINKTGAPKHEATERDAAATKQSIRSVMKHRRVVKTKRE